MHRDGHDAGRAAGRDVDVRGVGRLELPGQRIGQHQHARRPALPAARRRSPSTPRWPPRHSARWPTPPPPPFRQASPTRCRATTRRPTPTPSTPSADLSITKTDFSPTATPGSPVTYTVAVSNAGPSERRRRHGGRRPARVADRCQLDVLGQRIRLVPGVGQRQTSTRTISLTVGATATFTITGTLLASTTANLVNTATVTPPVGVDRSDARQQHRDRYRHAGPCRRPVDHQDRLRRHGDAGHRRQLSDRRHQRRPLRHRRCDRRRPPAGRARRCRRGRARQPAARRARTPAAPVRSTSSSTSPSVARSRSRSPAPSAPRRRRHDCQHGSDPGARRRDRSEPGEQHRPPTPTRSCRWPTCRSPSRRSRRRRCPATR